MNQKSINLKSVKKQVDRLTADSTTKPSLKLIFIALGLNWIWVAIWWPKLPPEIPLYFSRAYGEGRLANQWGIWILPTTSLIFSLVAIRIAIGKTETDKFLTRLILWSAVIINGMSLLTLIKIVFLVI